MTCIVIYSNTKTKNNQVKQLKIQKSKSQVQKNQNQNIICNDSLHDHNIGLKFILNVQKKIHYKRD